MRRLCQARGLHDPSPPNRFIVTTVSPQLRIAVVPPPRFRIPIMRLSLRLPALHIRTSLDYRRDAAGLADIAAQRKRHIRASAAYVTRFRPMIRGRGGATTIRALAPGEEDAEERAQGRGGRGDYSDADLDRGPDCNVHGGVEEVADVSHAADEWDADDCGG